MSVIFISDTNIWIDIRNAGLLDDVFRLPFTLCCTDFVVNELKDIPCDHLVALGLVVEVLESDAITELFNLRVQHSNSSLADVSCYYLANRTGHPLLTGDGRLRRQAMRDGIKVFGVLWLLDRLLEHEVILPPRAINALETMLEKGTRLPLNECQQRLQRWQTIR